jgi:transcriptional regulator with XRE-family HTH domain
MREYLVNLRKERNESQQDVADAIGITRQYYAMIEAGQRQKKLDVMMITLLSNHFGISVTEIIAQESTLPTTHSNTIPNPAP